MIWNVVRIIGIGLVLLWCTTNRCNAKSNPDERTVAFINAFTRGVTHHDKHHTQCIHTTNLATKHLDLWMQWNRTHRWPRLAARDYDSTKPGKSDATSVIRLSWYNYADSTSEIELDNHGRAGRFSARYDMGPYESHVSYLQPNQFNEIQRLVRNLPASRKVLNWSDVLLISGRRDGRWFVRMYSRSNKPKAVIRLLKILMPKTLDGSLRA
jgi:hypothetical protein